MITSIIVIEDDKDIQNYLQDLLTRNDFSVQTAHTGISGLSLMENVAPDLVLLDLTLPDMTGESVCKEIKKIHPNLPVIILTAKNAVSDKVRSLTTGADDYITKPFDSEELIARIKARLRNTDESKSPIQVADLTLNPKTFEVKRAGKVIHLTPQEYKLLEYLMNNQGIVLTRDMILNRIWLYSPDVQSRVVDVYIGYLRKKIDAPFKKKLLHSIRGFGFTLKD